VGRVVSALGLSLSLLAFAQLPPVREIAITFDDLPIAGVLPRDIETSRELTHKLLAGVAAHHVPAIGFVNEDKLNAADGTVDPQRVDLLRRWLDGGLERALEDPAFQSADTFVGTSGITWIHRWALTKKMPRSFYADEPEVPALLRR
jgi:peptidoglycan/xylan/chitin deacetylase (PgdA/CDA1 family)